MKKAIIAYVLYSMVFYTSCIRKTIQNESAVETKTVENRQNYIDFENEGIELYQEGQYKAAIPLLKKAIALNPNTTQAYPYLGVAFYKLKEHDQAVEVYDQMLAIYPTDVNAHTSRAEILRDKGDLAAAEMGILLAFSLEADDGYVLATTAMIQADKNNKKEFYQLMKQAISTSNDPYPLLEKIQEKKTLQKLQFEPEFQALLK